MSEFFTPRIPDGANDDAFGLAVFINAGDPPFPLLTDLAVALDDFGVDVLELAVPFPASPTDGATIRRSARRALEHGVDLERTLAWVDDISSRLERTKIALFGDWTHTVRPIGLSGYLERVADSGADATLVHGLMPCDQQEYVDTAGELGLPIVTTCYPTSSTRTIENSAATASAFLYLVAHYGRSGAADVDHRGLRPKIDEIRRLCDRPIAVGFGVSSASDLRAVAAAGADAAIVGSAFVERIERCLERDLDPIPAALSFLAGLRVDCTRLVHS